MGQRWIGGNKFILLENGEDFFPRVFEVIASAQSEVLLETFILYEDKVGLALHAALLAAARRGVKIDMTLDSFGSPDLSEQFISTLTAAGVRMHIFDPAPRLFRRVNYFRRMHRKIVVVDGSRAFVGGINYSADHLGDFGPEAKQDYAVEIAGPIVTAIHHFVHAEIANGKSGRRWFHRRRTLPAPPLQPAAGEAEALFVWRDNREHTNDIERQYRLAIRLARQRIIIANAYFFPSYLFLRDLRKAARRGVDVVMILQGNPDMQIAQVAASMLYHDLLQEGIRIYEYCERPLHGKVAVIDDDWATVGSSNLDPLSLALNLEANVFIRERGFNQQLTASLQRLIAHSCTEIQAHTLSEARWWRRLRGFILYHVLRRYPAWAGWLPAHVPRLQSVQPPPAAANVDYVSEKAGP